MQLRKKKRFALTPRSAANIKQPKTDTNKYDFVYPNLTCNIATVIWSISSRCRASASCRFNTFTCNSNSISNSVRTPTAAKINENRLEHNKYVFVHNKCASHTIATTYNENNKASPDKSNFAIDTRLQSNTQTHVAKKHFWFIYARKPKMAQGLFDSCS